LEAVLVLAPGLGPGLVLVLELALEPGLV